MSSPGAGPIAPPMLSIGRLSATLHVPPPASAGGGARADVAADVPRLLERLQSGLAGHGLAKAFAAAGLPPGRWFLRRVEVPVALDLARPEAALIQGWAGLLASTVRRTALAGGPQVAHYPTDAALLADVVHGAATGRLERAWAWTAAGVLAPSDPDPATRPGELLLAVTARRPNEVLPAVLALLRCPGGVVAMDRALGDHGWPRLAALLAPPDGLGQASGTDGVDSVHGIEGVSQVGGPGEHGHPSGVGPAPALAGSLLAGSLVAEQMLQSRLRPVPAVRAAWAALVVLDADPGSLQASRARELLAAVAAAIAARTFPGGSAAAVRVQPDATSGGRQGGDGTATVGWARGTHPVSTVIPAAVPGRDGSAGGPDVGSGGSGRTEPGEKTAGRVRDAGWPTGWAGLPFLLATADDAGLPAAAVDDPVLAARPLRWVLHALGGLLVPAAPDDPARLALAGLPPEPTGARLPGPPPTQQEAERLAELAAAWARTTAARLSLGASQDSGAGWRDAGSDPSAVVARLARRPGVVLGEPGWLEVRLPLFAVDPVIRMTGLDLDPGWLPWLGAVVRYVYA